MTDLYRTTVILRRWSNGDVIALMPDDPWDRPGYSVTSYEHIGQHGAADYQGVVSRTRPVRGSEGDALLAELRVIGYDPVVRQRRSRR